MYTLDYATQRIGTGNGRNFCSRIWFFKCFMESFNYAACGISEFGVSSKFILQK